MRRPGWDSPEGESRPKFDGISTWTALALFGLIVKFALMGLFIDWLVTAFEHSS